MRTFHPRAALLAATLLCATPAFAQTPPPGDMPPPPPHGEMHGPHGMPFDLAHDYPGVTFTPEQMSRIDAIMEQHRPTHPASHAPNEHRQLQELLTGVKSPDGAAVERLEKAIAAEEAEHLHARITTALQIRDVLTVAQLRQAEDNRKKIHEAMSQIHDLTRPPGGPGGPGGHGGPDGHGPDDHGPDDHEPDGHPDAPPVPPGYSLTHPE